MQLVVLDSAQAIARRAAGEIEALLKDKPAAVLGTAAGSSPLPPYNELTTRCATGRPSFAEAIGFMLDEYIDLSAGHPKRCVTFVGINLRSCVDMRPGALHGPGAPSEGLKAAYRDYKAQMTQVGYCDLQILGIGSDGRIRSNEPGGTLDSRTRLDELHGQTRRDNARFFGSGVEVMPTQCVAQGLATIMEARKLVLIATGEGKAEAIAQLVKEEVSAQWPATIMQRHDDTLMLVDPTAASRLTSTH